MASRFEPKSKLPRPEALRWEIAAALLLKALLLTGLWLLIFRWGGHRSPSQPDIAERLALHPDTASLNAPMPVERFSVHPPNQETSHGR